MRSRRWTWTLNNPTSDDIERLKGVGADLSTYHLRYLTWGNEVAPETGTPHLQGYAEFTVMKSLKKVKDLVSPRVHAEKSKGNGEQNQIYSQKEGDFLEFGVLTKQGKRTDILKIQEMIDAGHTDREIAIRYFSTWTRMRGAVKEYRALISPRRTNVPYSLTSFPEAWPQELPETVTIFWGESGVGKTCFAKALLPNALMVSHIDDLRLFQKDEHDGIIFDDMDFGHIPRTAQIHLVDSDDDRSIHCRYDCAVIPAGTKKIFTTNNFEGRIFLDDPAINRRIKIRHLIKL